MIYEQRYCKNEKYLLKIFIYIQIHAVMDNLIFQYCGTLLISRIKETSQLTLQKNITKKEEIPASIQLLIYMMLNYRISKQGRQMKYSVCNLMCHFSTIKTTEILNDFITFIVCVFVWKYNNFCTNRYSVNVVLKTKPHGFLIVLLIFRYIK